MGHGSKGEKSMTNGDYKFGIEEEYFLVDAQTKAVVVTRPPSFLANLKETLGDRISGEMLQAQVEVSTSPHTCMNTAAAELKHLRQTTAHIAAQHGLAIIA